MSLSRLNLVSQALVVHGVQAFALVGLGVWVANRMESGGLVFLAGTTVLAVLGLTSAAFVAHGCAKVLGQAATALEAARELDLGGRVPTERTDEAGRIARAVGHAFDVLAKAFGEVRGAANHLGTAASSVSAWAKEAENVSQQQASSLSTGVETLGSIRESVSANADQARQAHQLALKSREVAEAGGAAIRDTIGAMSEIDESSTRISAIAGTIDEIAFQTNLLALNAAVEAARAGESGRGFAVVAAEVRSLALRSAVAAREVKDLIRQSAERTQNGSRLAARAGATFDEVIAATRRVSDIVSELSAGLLEQGSAITKAEGAAIEAQERNALLAESGSQLDLHAEALRSAVTALATLSDAFSGVQTQAPPLVMPMAYSEEEPLPPLRHRNDPVPPPRRVSSDSVDYAQARKEPPPGGAFEGS